MPAREPGEPYQDVQHTGLPLPRRPSRPARAYRAWTRKVAGKTLTAVLSEEQFERYRPWAENSRRLHDLVAELEQLSVISMARVEGWPEPAPPPPDRRRARSTGGEKPS